MRKPAAAAARSKAVVPSVPEAIPAAALPAAPVPPATPPSDGGQWLYVPPCDGGPAWKSVHVVLDDDETGAIPSSAASAAVHAADPAQSMALVVIDANAAGTRFAQAALCRAARTDRCWRAEFSEVQAVAVCGAAAAGTTLVPSPDVIKVELDAPAPSAAVAVKPEAAMAPAAAPAPTAAQLADLLTEEPDDVLFEDMAVDLVRPRSDAQTHLLLRVGIPMHKILRAKTMAQAARMIEKALDFKKRGAAALSNKWLIKQRPGGGGGGAAGGGASGALAAG